MNTASIVLCLIRVCVLSRDVPEGFAHTGCWITLQNPARISTNNICLLLDKLSLFQLSLQLSAIIHIYVTAHSHPRAHTRLRNSVGNSKFVLKKKSFLALMTQLNAHKSKYFEALEQWECAGRDVGWDFMAIFQTFATSFESWNCKHLLFCLHKAGCL